MPLRDDAKGLPARTAVELAARFAVRVGVAAVAEEHPIPTVAVFVVPVATVVIAAAVIAAIVIAAIVIAAIVIAAIVIAAIVIAAVVIAAVALRRSRRVSAERDFERRKKLLERAPRKSAPNRRRARLRTRWTEGALFADQCSALMLEPLERIDGMGRRLAFDILRLDRSDLHGNHSETERDRD
jgi:hypothetical protein